MKKFLKRSILLSAAAVAIAAAPALAGGDFELRVTERLPSQTQAPAVAAPRPAQPSRAVNQIPPRDPTLLDQNGVFQSPRVR